MLSEIFIWILLVAALNLQGGSIWGATPSRPSPTPSPHSSSLKGVFPDCMEGPISYERLVDLANRPDVKNVTDFLERIPGASLQTFTLAYESQSAQKEDVSPLWPRVVRTSVDGKITLAYTCDPSKDSYNRVEISRWDETTSSYLFSELNFRSPPSQARSTRGGRVHENPQSCASCHNPSGSEPPDLRPNWGGYPDWRGCDGSHDDSFVDPAFGNREFRDRIAAEKANYLRFREVQKDNPCYGLLPWPLGKSSTIHPLYPYSDTYKSLNLEFRPNFRFTQSQFSLLMKRLARKLMQKSQFKEVVYLLLMDQIGCDSITSIDDQISQILPEYRSPQFDLDRDIDDPRFPEYGVARLYEVGRALGVDSSDWTLLFNPPSGDPSFETGFLGQVKEELKSALLDQLGSQIPEMRSFLEKSDRKEQYLGIRYRCLDQTAQPRLEKRESFCAWLRNRQNQVSVNSCGKPSSAVQRLMNDVGQMVDSVQLQNQEELRNRGKEILQQKCVRCHGHYAERLKGDPHLRIQIEGSVMSGRMPPPSPNSLTENEKAAIQAYLNSF